MFAHLQSVFGDQVIFLSFSYEQNTGEEVCQVEQMPCCPHCMVLPPGKFNSVIPERCLSQGDHLSGKPGNVREFDSCQGNVRDFTKNQGNVREKILSGKSCLQLFIVTLLAAYFHPYRHLKKGGKGSGFI